jgi:hypothetical protein
MRLELIPSMVSRGGFSGYLRVKARSSLYSTNRFLKCSIVRVRRATPPPCPSQSTQLLQGQQRTGAAPVHRETAWLWSGHPESPPPAPFARPASASGETITAQRITCSEVLSWFANEIPVEEPPFAPRPGCGQVKTTSPSPQFASPPQCPPPHAQRPHPAGLAALPSSWRACSSGPLPPPPPGPPPPKVRRTDTSQSWPRACRSV